MKNPWHRFRSRARFHLLALMCLGATNLHAQSAAPVISSISPTSGSPGDSVVIKGENFNIVDFVAFTGEARAAGEYTSTKITVTVPNDAQTRPIEVKCSGYDGVWSAHSFDVKQPTPTPTPAPPPVITSATTASGVEDQPFSYQITADRAVTQFYADDLPEGLSLDPASGVISGTPTQAGVFLVGISAIQFSTGWVNLTLTIASDAPAATMVAVPGTVDMATGQKVKLQFSLARAMPHDTFIAFKFSGTARPGFDYGLHKVGAATNSYLAKIPAGQTHATVKLIPYASPSPARPAGTVLVARFKICLEQCSIG